MSVLEPSVLHTVGVMVNEIEALKVMVDKVRAEMLHAGVDGYTHPDAGGLSRPLSTLEMVKETIRLWKEKLTACKSCSDLGLLGPNFLRMDGSTRVPLPVLVELVDLAGCNGYVGGVAWRTVRPGVYEMRATDILLPPEPASVEVEEPREEGTLVATVARLSAELDASRERERKLRREMRLVRQANIKELAAELLRREMLLEE